jgi:hypothetical protein
MYELLDVHPLTLVIVSAAVMVTPLHLMATYVFSGASARKGALIAAAVLAWGAVMAWVCLSNLVGRLGAPLGSLLVPLCWLAPSLVVFLLRDWLLAEPLSQRWLVGLQLWRVIGAVFLVEMARGKLPAIFAIPAGVGDVLVAVLAAGVLWVHRRAAQLPSAAVMAVVLLGAADFLSAFFFGFFSSVGPQQFFFPAVRNDALLFPTGMIPLFLVPYAIAFHTLSVLALRRSAGLATPARALAASPA